MQTFTRTSFLKKNGCTALKYITKFYNLKFCDLKLCNLVSRVRRERSNKNRTFPSIAIETRPRACSEDTKERPVRSVGTVILPVHFTCFQNKYMILLGRFLSHLLKYNGCQLALLQKISCNNTKIYHRYKPFSR